MAINILRVVVSLALGAAFIGYAMLPYAQATTPDARREVGDEAG